MRLQALDYRRQSPRQLLFAMCSVVQWALLNRPSLSFRIERAFYVRETS